MKKVIYFAGLYWHGIYLGKEEILDLKGVEDPLQQKWHLKIKDSHKREKIANMSCGHWQRSQKQVEWLLNKGVHLLSPWHVDYPEAFKSLRSPPFLSVFGDPRILSYPAMSVVGSRSPNYLSLEWMRRELYAFIKESEVVIVSGGARGVDQEAHRLCIANKKPTICFLPSGLAKVYPADLLHWFSSILDTGGAIVSQFAPFTQLYKSHFHRRNELIAALSRASLIVEARLRSGSLLTARKAMDLGREVGTLPCSPHLMNGRGNLQLLMEGAQMITNSEDLNTFWYRNLVTKIY